jgi:hypothetical protein
MVYPLITTWTRFAIISACDFFIVVFRLYYGVGRINTTWKQLRQNNNHFMTTIKICLSIPLESLLELPLGSILSNGTATTADADDDFSQLPMESNKDTSSRPRHQILGGDNDGGGGDDIHDVEVNMNGFDDNDDDEDSAISKPHDKNIFRQDPGKNQAEFAQDQSEQDCDGLYLYQAVDAIAVFVIEVAIRIFMYIGVTIAKYYTKESVLNSTFETTHEQWKDALIKGGAYIMVFIIGLLSARWYCRIYFPEKLVNANVGITAILLYNFKIHFWFYVSLYGFALLLCTSSMISHFGYDFTMKFEYRHCPGNTAWPVCADPTLNMTLSFEG